MNDVPETTFEVMKLSTEKTSATRIASARLKEIAQCAEGDQLKQEYDSALEVWRKQSQPPVRAFREVKPVLRAFQLTEALAERNAAANRLYLHRAGCAMCRRRR
jgi:ferric-dicitrate binding protein FerR (iron transport regulator)